MWWKLAVSIVVVLAVLASGAIIYGKKRSQSEMKGLQLRLENARVPIAPGSYDPKTVAGLPAPVQRYFRTVLKNGQPLVVGAHVEHEGTFNMSEAGEQWKPFTSSQYVVTARPGFLWDARIRMAPGMTALVHDAYIEGEGLLAAKLFGLLTVMEQPSTPELAQGELMRFFAEAVWYPTALLPGRGVVWQGIDGSRARASIEDGGTAVELFFTFNSDGLITRVRSEGRFRETDGVMTPMPWEGSFWDYEERDGMLVPIEGEVAWITEDGPLPYWRGSIRKIEYEYAE